MESFQIRICFKSQLKFEVNRGDDTVDGKHPANHLGCIKPCKQWDKLPVNWCRVSSINCIMSRWRIWQSDHQHRAARGRFACFLFGSKGKDLAEIGQGIHSKQLTPYICATELNKSEFCCVALYFHYLLQKISPKIFSQLPKVCLKVPNLPPNFINQDTLNLKPTLPNRKCQKKLKVTILSLVLFGGNGECLCQPTRPRTPGSLAWKGAIIDRLRDFAKQKTAHLFVQFVWKKHYHYLKFDLGECTNLNLIQIQIQ